MASRIDAANRRTDLLPDRAHLLRPGDYMLVEGDVWFNTPTGLIARITPKWTITHHEDGTLSASPSIAVNWPHKDGPFRWHGYLERDVWRTLDDSTPAEQIAAVGGF